jgi:catechol 2,3-dioxygenase-like lactoylglutathione lyase family enzyme
MQVHLLFADDPVVPPEGHVAVVADDYGATVDRLRRAGFDVVPRTEHWGSPRAFVRSPSGHRVELMATAPVV